MNLKYSMWKRKKILKISSCQDLFWDQKDAMHGMTQEGGGGDAHAVNCQVG